MPVLSFEFVEASAMFICVCKAVREREVKAEVEAGASTFREVRDALEVGTCCGRCVPVTRALIDDSLRQIAARIGVAA